jgi:hypothetical protein
MVYELVVSVKTRRDPAVTREDGLPAVEIVCAAYRSVAAGRLERVRTLLNGGMPGTHNLLEFATKKRVVRDGRTRCPFAVLFNYQFYNPGSVPAESVFYTHPSARDRHRRHR